MSTVYAGTHKVVAQMVGESAEMDDLANSIAALCRAEAAKHEKDGTFERSIEVVKAGGGKDRLIQSTDPLAVPKELGHILVVHGETVGYVKGMHTMSKVYAALPRVE